MTTVVIGLLLMRVGLAAACEPCAESWDLTRTAQEADLVVLAQKVREGSSTDHGRVLGERRPQGGPDWIDVKVLRTFKGGVSASRLRANSWDGMCRFGIVVDDRPHVLFLMKPSSGNEYQALNFGCSVTALPVEEDQVHLGEQTVSLATFAAWLASPNGPLDPGDRL